DSVCRRDVRDPVVPGIRAGLRDDGRWAGRLDVRYRVLPLSAGFHLFPHGLRQRGRLRAVRHHLRPHAVAVQTVRKASRGVKSPARPSRRKAKVSAVQPLLHGMLILAGVITVLPYVWMVSSSFKANSAFFSATIQLIPEQPPLDNYVVALPRQ